MLNSTLWILLERVKALGSDNTFWERHSGNFVANIACKAEFVNNIPSVVAAVRNLRVGNNARYPTINIFTRPSDLNIELCHELRKCDNTTPRIRVFLVVNAETYDARTVDHALECLRNDYIDARYIFILEDKYCLPRDLLVHINKMAPLTLEYFPSVTQMLDSDRAIQIVSFLKEIHYDSAQHPLYMCGAISEICRKILLLPLHANCEQKNNTNIAPPLNKQYLSSFQYIPQPCLRGMLGYLFDDKEFTLKRICSCGVNNALVPTFIPNDSYPQTIDKSDYRLFEDWQYIYDGFDCI